MDRPNRFVGNWDFAHFKAGFGILKQNGVEIRDFKYARNADAQNNPRDPGFALCEGRESGF